jgi:hypothetical protein
MILLLMLKQKIKKKTPKKQRIEISDRENVIWHSIEINAISNKASPTSNWPRCFIIYTESHGAGFQPAKQFQMADQKIRPASSIA